MSVWFDMLLGLIIVWEGIIGALYGFRAACLRLIIFVAAVGVSLPFASNTSLYLRPVLEPVFHTAIEQKGIAVSTGPTDYQFLGPWQNVVGVPTVTGMDLFLERLVSLAVNMSGLIFLVIVLVVAHRLVERRKVRSGSGRLGAVVGFAVGFSIVMVILSVSPIIALAEKGSILASALEGSMGAKTLKSLVQAMVNMIAPFVH